MKHKIYIIIVLFLSATTALFAQQKGEITGTVTDKGGNPLEGVAVIERGVSTNGVMTDSLGRYKISAASDAILEFSCIGYKNKGKYYNFK